jgi:hypothetical protein
MDNSIIYFPIKCPCCGQEYLVVSSLDMIVNALPNERHLILSSVCVPPRDVGRQRERA